MSTPPPAPPTGTAVHLLSDDLLERIFACVAHDGILRSIAPVCRRWAELLRTRPTLWPRVSIVLPPRLVNLRGRDRRHSYKLPCALDVDLLRTWLAARANAITELRLEVLYPDGMALLGFLTAPLAPGLRRLEIQAQMHEWPLFEIDWRFMQRLTALESLALHDAVPDLMALEGTLPRGLTELHVSSEAAYELDEEDLMGWEEAPPCLAQLSRLRRLTLGGCQFSSWSGNEQGFDPLAACASLEHLGLPGAAFDSLPAQLERLAPRLTSLDLSNMAASPGSWRSLASLTGLRRLDISCASPVAREGMPPEVFCLTRLTFLDICGREAEQSGLSAILSRLPSLRHLRYSAEAPLQLVIERPGGLLLGFVPPPARQHLRGRSASAPARLGEGALDLLQAAAALV